MRSTKATKARAVAAALAIGFWAAAGVAHADPAPTPAPGPAPGPAAKTTIATNGTFKVGTDIAPGTYSSAGPIADGVCSWKRSNGEGVVDNAMTKKPQVVQIDATDTTFTTRDCQPWQLTDCSQGCEQQPAASPAAILGQLGTFLAPRLGGPPPAGPPPAATPGG